MAEMRYFEEGGKLYKQDSDGERYRISFSEELQLKNLKEAKRNQKLLAYALYAKIAIAFLLLILVFLMVFVFYRLDTINFFTGILYR